MIKIFNIFLFVFLIFAFLFLVFWKTTKTAKIEPQVKPSNMNKNNGQISLPQPNLKGQISLEEAIVNRRSQRDFSDKPLTLSQLSQILWAAQGITNKEMEFRTAPSAGALYPLEVYVLVRSNGVETLKAGVYHFLPKNHSIEIVKESDLTNELVQVALGQSFLADAAVNIVIAAEYERTTGKYGERGVKYVHMEVGHVSQNIYLQVESLGLGTVTIGAFHDKDITSLLNLPPNHHPLYLMPIGWPK